MRDNEITIGLDIGTTSTKAVAFGPQGHIRGIHSEDYPLIYPRSSWVEQDPEILLEAAVTAIREVMRRSGADANELIGIGISSAMHSLIVLDRSNTPITRSIIWADNRSSGQVKRLKEELAGNQIYLRTGTPMHPMSPLSKILWLKEEDPGCYEQAGMFLGIKEYILFRLFGRFVMDCSLASATGLFNLREFDWDQEVLELLNIREEQLPALVPPTEVLSGLPPVWAERMGIGADTPFVIGAGDGVLANLGVGAIEPGELAVTIGTSGAIRMMSDTPITDALGRTFCYALNEQHWVIGGATSNGGIVLSWLREKLASAEWEEAVRHGADIYELMIKSAASIAPGADGLLLLPFLSGERAPYWNASARGVFFGLSLQHQREHLIRAGLEGVIYSILSVGEALQEIAGPAREIRASGGFAKSAIWRQMLSDMLGREVLVPESCEASALGAAILAMQALGHISSLNEARSWIHIVNRHEPCLDRHAIYSELFAVYTRLYERLEPEFNHISRFKERNRH
ncbi:gluconate kinase, FGGY family [Paenibacillus algorifonticola]|uniref:Gluconate kinase, FGGY family n=1 Tax=Paenibacillus algorifonticola TaxID=684063 RepID=A0A1I2H758_9BACL|nr:FGGY family carbohydrate kinase [Paenibacillus algorifonticola]SFF26025.1 gluconate kinase, FGGY family [Paenibacillus algorifonticola]